MTERPWSELEHAYGAADDLPDAFAAFDSKNRNIRLHAIRDIESRIAHQHTVYSASAASVPLIVERLERKGAPDRDALARVLGVMSWSQGKKADVAAVAAALDAQAPRIAALLDDEDPEMRLALASAAMSGIRRSPVFVTAVLRRLDVERELAPFFAVTVAPAFADCREPRWLAGCHAQLSHAELSHRLVGAVVLTTLLCEKAPDAAVAPILEVLAKPAEFDAAWSRAIWSRAGIVGDLANTASRLGNARRELVLPSLCDAMETSPVAPVVAEAMLFMSFRAAAPSKAEALAPVQRAALLRLIRCDRAWNDRLVSVLELAKLPRTRDALRTWLGLTNDGVLDRLVELGKTAPLHEHLSRLIWKKNLQFPAIAKAFGNRISHEDWLDALLEISQDRFELSTRRNDRCLDLEKAWGAAVKKAQKVNPEAIQKLLRSRLDQKLDKEERGSRENQLLLNALAVTTKGPLDPKYDAIIDCSSLEAYHARIPTERLENLVLRDLAASAAALGEPDKGDWGIGFARVAEDRIEFLKLCPTRRLANAILGLSGLSGIGEDVVKRVARLKGKKAVAASLADFGRRERKAETYLAMRAALRGYVDEVYPPQSAQRKRRT